MTVAVIYEFLLDVWKWLETLPLNLNFSMRFVSITGKPGRNLLFFLADRAIVGEDTLLMWCFLNFVRLSFTLFLKTLPRFSNTTYLLKI